MGTGRVQALLPVDDPVRLAPERAEAARKAAEKAGVSVSRWIEQAVALRLEADDDKVDVQLHGVPAPMPCRFVEGRIVLNDGSVVPVERVAHFVTRSRKLADALRQRGFAVK